MINNLDRKRTINWILSSQISIESQHRFILYISSGKIPLDLFDVFVTVFTFNKHILCLTVQISSFAPCTDAIEDLYDLFSDIVLFHLCRSSIGVDFDVFLKGFKKIGGKLIIFPTKFEYFFLFAWISFTVHIFIKTRTLFYLLIAYKSIDHK